MQIIEYKIKFNLIKFMVKYCRPTTMDGHRSTLKCVARCAVYVYAHVASRDCYYGGIFALF